MRENHLKKQLRAGEQTVGLWAQFGSPMVAEALGQTDADWILLDCEHGASGWDALIPMLQGLGNSNATSIVRIPRADTMFVARLLDAGAEGILIPQVKTAEDVEAIVSATRYPPSGSRGIGPYRAARLNADGPAYFQTINEQIAVVAQIETREAVDNLEEILAVDGLDAVLIGPMDLSAAFGHFLNPGHEEVEAVFAQVLATCQAKGMPAGFYCDSGKVAKGRLEQGFQMVSVTSDIGALAWGVRQNLKAARGS